MTDADDRRRVALHELAHGLTGRALGHHVRTIVTVPGVGKLGWCDHYPRTDLSPFEAALDHATILLAGEMGEWLVPAAVSVGRVVVVDDDRAAAVTTFVEALHLLSDREEAQSIYAMQTSGGDGLADHAKAEREAETVAYEEHALLFGYCTARARRIVGEQASLIVALLPDIVSRPVVTGDELEALIQACSGPECSRAAIEVTPSAAVPGDEATAGVSGVARAVQEVVTSANQFMNRSGPASPPVVPERPNAYNPDGSNIDSYPSEA